MAKQSYKIPHDLASGFLDVELGLQKQDGLGIKPLPIKVILFYIGSVLFIFWVCFKTFMTAAPLWLLVLLVIVWLCFTYILGKYLPTKEMQMHLIPTFLSYAPKSARYVTTRATSPARNMYSIVPIIDIDDNNIVYYNDGTLMTFYHVVGSASILLFDDDRVAILDRVDSFWRKLGDDVEIITITDKEPQRIYQQIANLKRRHDNLVYNDPGLYDLLDEQFDILREYVGGSFKSIHQYIVLKANNAEALRMAHTVLQSEVENSSLMIKSCIQLNRGEIISLLKKFYQLEDKRSLSKRHFKQQGKVSK